MTKRTLEKFFVAHPKTFFLIQFLRELVLSESPLSALHEQNVVTLNTTAKAMQKKDPPFQSRLAPLPLPFDSRVSFSFGGDFVVFLGLLVDLVVVDVVVGLAVISVVISPTLLPPLPAVPPPLLPLAPPL